MNSNWQEFFKELQANNNRPWFMAHDAEYKALRNEWFAELDRMIAAMGLWDSRLSRFDARECTYRIHRDTRFSPDKTPYKTFFSASISTRGRKSPEAGYYIQCGADRDDCMIYAGIHCPEPAALKKLRKAIVDNIEEFEDIVLNPELLHIYGPQWYGERLKTAPKGWPKDHPQLKYLQLKHLGKGCELPPSFFSYPSWPEKAAGMFHTIKPLVDFINYTLEEE